MATHAYPVKTDDDKAKLESVLNKINEEQSIVIICPQGGGGAERTYDYLKSKDIDESLFLF